jgi:hypothetical protein
MKKTKKLLSILLVMALFMASVPTFGISVSAAYGDDDDVWSYYFTLDRIPGVDGYPGQALDTSVSISSLQGRTGGDVSVSKVSNGGTTVDPNDETIEPDTVYTYVIQVNYNGADPLYYGYSSGSGNNWWWNNNTVKVYWNNTQYTNNTYDAGHYNSTTSTNTWSKFGFVTPKTASTYSHATGKEDLVYNGTNQRLIKDDQEQSSDRVIISYRVDNSNTWTTDLDAVTAKNAGNHTVYWRVQGKQGDSGLDSSKTNSGNFTVNIAPLPVTVTPDDEQTKIYGEKDPTITYTVEANDEGAEVPAGDLNEDGMFKKGALARVAGEDVNEDGYAYTIGTLQTQNTNYEITLADEDAPVFMIDRKDITSGGVNIALTNSDAERDEEVYQYYYKGESQTAELSLIYSGAEVPSIKNENLVLSEDYNIVSGDTVIEYIDAEGTSHTITVRGIGNYIGVDTLDWRVIKNLIGTIETEPYEGVYDGANHTFTLDDSKIVPEANAEITYIYDPDSDTDYTAEWDESLATATKPEFKDVNLDAEGNVIPYTVYYRVHSEVKDPKGTYRYSDIYGKETVLINKKKVTLVAEDKEKVYDKDMATDPELTYEDYADQMVGTETLAGITLSREEQDTEVGQNADEYDICFNLDEINAQNPNYDVTETAGTFTITPRPVKVAVGDYEKTYSEVNPELALTIEQSGDEGVAENEGLLPGDELTGDALDEILEVTDAEGKVWAYDRFIDAGEYTIGQGTLEHGNYAIAFTDGTLTVNRKDITLPGSNVAILYNGSRTESVFNYTGKTIKPEFTMTDEQEGVEYVNYEDDIDFEVKGVYKASDYGIYTVVIKGLHNYVGEIDGQWAILPAVDEEYDYDGEEHTIAFNFDAGLEDGTVLGIKYSETEPEDPTSADSYDLDECPSYVDAGTYKIYYGIILNPEEYGAELVYPGCATLTINPIEFTPTLKLANWTYSRQESEPVLENNPSDGEVTYYYKLRGADDSTYTTEKPTQAGLYTVKADIAASGGYLANSATADFKIYKIKITITLDDKESLLQDPITQLTYSVEGNYAEGDNLAIIPTTDAKKSKAGEYEITATCGNPNYFAIISNGTYTVKDRITDKEKLTAKSKLDRELRGTCTSTGIKVQWGTVPKADRYKVYATYCNYDDTQYDNIKTVSGDVTSFSFTKLEGSTFNTKKYVKLYVVAYRKVEGKYTKIQKSTVIHIAGKNAVGSNVKATTVTKATFELEVGKTATIKAKNTLENTSKKEIAHVAQFRYRTSDASIATVDTSGKITAVAPGVATINVFANNGCYKTVKVIVK